MRGLLRMAQTDVSEMASQLPGPLLSIAALLLALAACSAPTEQSSDSDLKTKLRLTRPNQIEPQKHWGSTRALGAEDFVGPDGRCPDDTGPFGQPAPGALQFQPGPEAPPSAPAAPAPGAAQPSSLVRAIGLDMSECEVVRALGPTTQVEITTTERGERSVALTYVQGERPGIYRFVSGRLKSMERAPELPTAAKPAPAKKPGKKPAAS